MVEVSLLAAFFGGVLSLLSPCSALLLPAFFAYAFQSRGELVGKTAVFYLGLCSDARAARDGHLRGQLALLRAQEHPDHVSGVVIIAFGLLQLLGRRLHARADRRLRGRVRGDSVGAVFSLGAVYGFAGFCSGPILGAVLTVAAASGWVLRGAASSPPTPPAWPPPSSSWPSSGTAWTWGRRRWLRGREISLGALRLHTTNLLSGLMFML